MRWAANVLAAGLALAMSGHPAAAAEPNSQGAAQIETVSTQGPHGREVLDERVTQVTIQAAFDPSDDRQKLLSLLLLLSAPPRSGSGK
jgi:hypothetical protein